MTIKTEAQWKTAYGDLDLVNTDAWKLNLANYIGDMIVGMALDGCSPAPTFTWKPATFAAALTGTPNAGVLDLQTAFSAAILASSFTFVVPMATETPQDPATSFSVVTTAVATNIPVGQAKIALLANAPQTNVATDSEFPVRLYEAFESLIYLVSGTNAVTPTTSPLALPIGVV